MLSELKSIGAATAKAKKLIYGSMERMIKANFVMILT
jgi:hypothetical protein